MVHQLSDSQLATFLNGLADMIKPVTVAFQYRPQMKDADDEMVLETVINGYADGIVTHNVKDFIAAAFRFGVLVLNPGNALEELRK